MPYRIRLNDLDPGITYQVHWNQVQTPANESISNDYLYGQLMTTAAINRKHLKQPLGIAHLSETMSFWAAYV